jgi:predicted acetyltransferase
MNWEQIGFQHERYVDDDGRIVGEVESRPGKSMFAAYLFESTGHIGNYVSVDAAKKAVQRAYAEDRRL